jgi:succinyl-diaminopimelate desuccinylase
MNPVELTKELIKIDSRNPPGDTTDVVEYLESLFSIYNTKILEKEEGKPNLIVYISKGSELMLNSHVDTVPSSDSLLNPVTINGKLYGRGACDAKGCVAVIISAIQDFEPEYGLKLVFSSDEEVGGVNGLGYVFEREQADYVLIGEPFGCDRIGIIQSAVVSADIFIKGKSGHTATTPAVEGAVYKASEYIMRVVGDFLSLKGNFNQFEKMIRNLGLDFEIRGVGQAVFNPAMIQGGIKRNIVSPECTISADIRFMPWIHQDEIRKILSHDCAEFKVNGVLKPFGFGVDDVDMQKDKTLLNMLIMAIKANGLKPTGVCSLGVGDTRHVRKYGVPAFYYGPRGDGLHGDNEFVWIEELYKSTKVLRTFLEMFDEKVMT